uniref:ATP synthase subunit a n=1 Tax=Typosyllis antoni TaxID=1898412 RepID=A0A1C9UZE6_9ANNE|nr:ATP synthase F0 subunit 6 [Typosyllis antoni]AOR87159.1 ATP synthase F0 subunit 6 [Typosyllis antoni]
MMSSTFTAFDMMLTNQSSPLLSYGYGLLPIIIFSQIFWVSTSNRAMILFSLVSTSSSLTKSTNSMFMKSAIGILTPTFMLIVLLNLYGAAPYTISLTSHLMMTLSLGLPLWFAMILMAMSTSIKLTSAHLLPENTPKFIASFLLLVETLSTYIRPITLSFRLSANISAGHVILGMMTSAFVYVMFSSMFISKPMLISTGYTMFELAICLIQAFVFILLTSMYSNDYLAIKN